MTKTATAPRVLYYGMPSEPRPGEPGSYTCARLIVQAMDNWDLPACAAVYEESATGWNLGLLLTAGFIVRIEHDGSGRLPRTTVAVHDAPAHEVDMPLGIGEGWEAKAARVAREVRRAVTDHPSS